MATYLDAVPSSSTMSVLRVPAVSVFTVFLVMVIHLGTLVGSTTATKMHYIHWNTSNPIFRIDNTDHIIDVNKNNFPFDYDQVNIICPTYDKSTKDHETEKYIIYNVSKEEYDTCRITTLHPRVITVCNKPYDLMYVTITFRPFSPQPNGLEFRPGVDYYFISTSSSDDLERRIGGRCSSHHMKVVFKVCCDPDKQQQAKPLGDQGGTQRGRNGPGSSNRRGDDDDDHIIGNNSTLNNNNANKTSITSLSTAAKSGRTPFSTPSSSTPSTTTTTPSTPRRRMPPLQRNPDVGVGGSPSSYDYSDYAIHKDYPYYVKTTTRKVDTRKYPDPRENEVVKNEALNRSPVPSTSHHLSFWWIMLVLFSTTVVVTGNGTGGVVTGGCSGAKESGDGGPTKKRKAVDRRRRAVSSEWGDSDQRSSLDSFSSKEGRCEDGGGKVTCSTQDLCLTNHTSHCNDDTSSNNLHHQFVLLPQRPRHHYNRPSSSSHQYDQQQKQLQRSGSQSLLTNTALLSPPLTGQQSTRGCQWLHQRRKFDHQINSFRCRSRPHSSALIC